jgi:hypothetical protein
MKKAAVSGATMFSVERTRPAANQKDECTR